MITINDPQGYSTLIFNIATLLSFTNLRKVEFISRYSKSKSVAIINYFFVEKHNEQVRNFWHNRFTTISCRTEFTIKGAAHPFESNIIAFLYNECLADLRQKARNLYQRDYNLIQRAFDLDRACMTNKEQFFKALEIKHLEPHEVWSTLELNYVGSARIQGFQKELFYLKCLTNNMNPQFILRCLYQMKGSPRPDTRAAFDHYRNEIIYLLDKIIVKVTP